MKQSQQVIIKDSLHQFERTHQRRKKNAEAGAGAVATTKTMKMRTVFFMILLVFNLQLMNCNEREPSSRFCLYRITEMGKDSTCCCYILLFVLISTHNH